MARPRLRGYPAALGALLLVGAAGAAPWYLSSGTTPPWQTATQQTAPVAVPSAPAPLPPVKLTSVATPSLPGGGIAAAPQGNSVKMAGIVAAEDERLRLLLKNATRVQATALTPLVGALPTLILRPRPEQYTIADIEAAGAARPLSDGSGMLLVDSVLVAPGAQLVLGGNGLQTLLMNSTSAGFASIVNWGGTLTITGDTVTNAPLRIVGWDSTTQKPAGNDGTGRAYIRDVGGLMDLRNVQASDLGFWSGRTGGVAWTGTSTKAASGGAVDCTFTSNTYGAFVSAASEVTFTDDLFEGNQLDGLRLNRYANNTKVTGSASARNGGNGFAVSRGANADTFTGDVAVHNAGNGFLLDGQPLVSGASPSGLSGAESTGLAVEASDAESNLKSGVVIEGGSGTVVSKDIFGGGTSAVEVRTGATNTWILGNDIRPGSREGVSIGPAVTGTTVDGNVVDAARIGVVVTSSPGVRLIDNALRGISIFGISVRGASPGVVGNGNSIAGLGIRPIDTTQDTASLDLIGTSTAGWVHNAQTTVFSYLRYHPLLTTWVGIALLIVLWWLLAHVRRRPVLPYRHTLTWQPSTATAPADQQELALTGAPARVTPQVVAAEWDPARPFESLWPALPSDPVGLADDQAS